jgi:hypothetical protein
MSLLILDWWAGKDSNLGRHMPTDLQSALVDRLSTYPGKSSLCTLLVHRLLNVHQKGA